MKRFVFVVLALAVLGSSLFGQIPQSSAQEKQFRSLEAYTERLVVECLLQNGSFPHTHGATVIVYWGYEPSVEVDERGVIHITSEFFKVFPRADKRLVVLTHELSHRELKHKSAELFTWYGPIYNLALLEQNEIEADWHSVFVLNREGMDICIAPQVLETFIDGYHMRDNPDSPVNRINFKRLELLKLYCQNKKRLLDFKPASLDSERFDASQFVRK